MPVYEICKKCGHENLFEPGTEEARCSECNNLIYVVFALPIEEEEG